MLENSSLAASYAWKWWATPQDYSMSTTPRRTVTSPSTTHSGRMMDSKPNPAATSSTHSRSLRRKVGGKYADQQQVYQSVGSEILDNAWLGYHCCLFAYGQTGSGKSYSMIGYGANKGIVPISC